MHAKLLSKPFIRLWNRILGEERMNEWIDYDEKVLFGKEKTQNATVDTDGGAEWAKDLEMTSIPKAKFTPDSPYAHG